MSYKVHPIIYRKSVKSLIYLEQPALYINLLKKNYCILKVIESILSYLNFYILSYKGFFLYNTWNFYITYYKKRFLKEKKKLKRKYLKIKSKFKYSIIKGKIEYKNFYIGKHLSNFFVTRHNNSLHANKWYLKRKQTFHQIRLKSLLFNKLLSLYISNKLCNIFNYQISIFTKCLNWSLYYDLVITHKSVLKELDFFNKKKVIQKYKKYKNVVFLFNIATYCRQPQVISDYFVLELCKLRKQWFFIYFMLDLFKVFYAKHIDLEGIRFKIAGRVMGRNRAKAVVKSIGYIPIATISADIRYGSSYFSNIYGAFCIRVWFYYI